MHPEGQAAWTSGGRGGGAAWAKHRGSLAAWTPYGAGGVAAWTRAG